MAFEQNQQNQFNINNGIDQVKQFQAELDKATASIGAAELEAEEELLGVRLKNLSKYQQIKLTQLGQMLELEEKSIQELAKLKLTLSNRQFAVRKKEIQREFQLYKAAADEFFKAENKRKATKSSSSSKKSTDELKASNKPNKAADDAIQKASKKVQSAIYGVNKVYQEVNEAITSLQDLASESQKLQKETKKASASTAKAVTQANTANTTEYGSTKTEIKAQEGQQFSSNSNGMEGVDLGKATSESVRTGYEGILSYLESSRKLTKEQAADPGLLATARLNKTITKDLDSITTEDSTATQISLDLADKLIKEINEANEAEAKIKEFNANKELNTRLIFAQKEFELRQDYLQEYQMLQVDGWNRLTENMTYEQFIALKKQTKAAEDSIAAREKASAASEKALATLRGKGTLAEKKEQLKAQIKMRAAEKDWSGKKEKKEASDFSKRFNDLLQKSKPTASIADKASQLKAKVDKKTDERFEKRFKMMEITDSMNDQQKAEAEEHNKKIQKNRETAAAAEIALNAAMEGLANLAKKLSNQTDNIGKKQALIDTRLQGSNVNDTYKGSYWKQLSKDIISIGATNPYFTQEDFTNNIKTLIDKGISFDIKQRAFLMTIQEKIANTFDVADGTLLRLIRIQQQDTTAGRLGMESALNSFLNSMYETSEYLTDVASSVRSSLLEMQAFETGDIAAELEFQVQKWMGSLYSVGMSQEAVQSIAQTFGQIASGDVNGLTGNGTGNLIIMAANEADLPIADILQEGLDAKNTNKLMQAMVNYLAEIAEASSDSRVVQQQFANVFGVKASDLKAATNLATSLEEVSNQELTYSGMLGQLKTMANSMKDRTSMAEMYTNIWDNMQYTLANQMGNNPILYLLPKVATLLEDFAGGIDLPTIMAFGTGVGLNTSVAQLMNVAALSGSILNSLGPMISSLGSSFSGSTMLSNAGINTSGKVPVIARGEAPVLQHLGGSSISESGYIGQGDGKAIKEQTLQDAEDSSKKQLVEAKDEESTTEIATNADLAVVKIYNLLEEVAHGTQSLRVKVVEGNTGGGGNTDNGNWVFSF